MHSVAVTAALGGNSRIRTKRHKGAVPTSTVCLMMTLTVGIIICCVQPACLRRRSTRSIKSSPGMYLQQVVAFLPHLLWGNCPACQCTFPHCDFCCNRHATVGCALQGCQALRKYRKLEIRTMWAPRQDESCKSHSLIATDTIRLQGLRCNLQAFLQHIRHSCAVQRKPARSMQFENAARPM